MTNERANRQRQVGLALGVILLTMLAACGGGGGGDSGISPGAGGVNPPPLTPVDYSSICTTLQGYVDPNAKASDSKVTGFSFTLFNRSGTLQTCVGGDQTLSSVKLIASASKMPSVAAILTLVDAGKLNLDAPVGSYLNGGANGSTVTWPSDKAAITMRMLLNHTSGLVGIADNQPACINNETGTTLAACTQIIANTTLKWSPGSHFNYGGVDYQVAGYVATLLSGVAWQTFFANAIGTPLGLTAYTYGNPATVTNPRIAGGAASNVTDYMTILSMLQAGGLYGGKQVLSSSIITRELETNQIAGITVDYSPLDSTKYPGYAGGLFISDPSLYPGSPGPEFSDAGLFGTVPWFDNGLGYGAVLLINSNTATGVSMWNTVRPQIISKMTAR